MSSTRARYFNPLRIAAYVLVLYFLGHTWGALLSTPAFGAEGNAVLSAMKSVQFRLRGLRLHMVRLLRGVRLVRLDLFPPIRCRGVVPRRVRCTRSTPGGADRVDAVSRACGRGGPRLEVLLSHPTDILDSDRGASRIPLRQGNESERSAGTVTGASSRKRRRSAISASGSSMCANDPLRSIITNSACGA